MDIDKIKIINLVPLINPKNAKLSQGSLALREP